MSTKIKLGDMSYRDRKQYQYYKGVLADLDFYGEKLLREVATSVINQVEQKYVKEKEHVKN